MSSAVSSGTSNRFSPSKVRTPLSPSAVRARFGHPIACLFRSRCRSRQIPPGDHKVPLPHLPFDVPLRPVVDLQPTSRRMFLLRASASLRSAPASRRGPLFIPAHTCISSTVRHSLRGPTAGTSIFRSHGFGLLAEDKKAPCTSPPHRQVRAQGAKGRKKILHLFEM